MAACLTPCFHVSHCLHAPTQVIYFAHMCKPTTDNTVSKTIKINIMKQENRKNRTTVHISFSSKQSTKLHIFICKSTGFHSLVNSSQFSENTLARPWDVTSLVSHGGKSQCHSDYFHLDGLQGTAGELILLHHCHC